MRRIILLIFALSTVAFAQTASRVDIPLLTAGPGVPQQGGALPQTLWVANSTAYLCTHPSATLGACQSNLITTYTDGTEAVQCSSATQLVQLPGNTCTASTGVASNIGAWVAISGPFDYWVTSSYGTYGPFTFFPPSNGCPLTGGCSFTGPVNAPNLQNVVNVNAYPYNAQGNVQSITDAVVNGTTTLTSASANFTASVNALTARVWMGSYQVYSGTVTSGVTAVGLKGQTCTLSSFNGGGSGATATFVLSDTSTIPSNAVIMFSNTGSGYTSAPTSATVGSGTAYCTGTAVVSTTLLGTPVNTTCTLVNSTTCTLGTAATINTTGVFAQFGTDDCTALSSAATAYANTAAKLTLRHGTYFSSCPINFNPTYLAANSFQVGPTLEGEASGGTVLEYIGSAAVPFIYNSTAAYPSHGQYVRGLNLRNLQIIGSSTTTSAVNLDTVSDVTWENVDAWGGGNCFTFYEVVAGTLNRPTCSGLVAQNAHQFPIPSNGIVLTGANANNATTTLKIISPRMDAVGSPGIGIDAIYSGTNLFDACQLTGFAQIINEGSGSKYDEFHGCLAEQGFIDPEFDGTYTIISNQIDSTNGFTSAPSGSGIVMGGYYQKINGLTLGQGGKLTVLPSSQGLDARSVEIGTGIVDNGVGTYICGATSYNATLTYQFPQCGTGIAGNSSYMEYNNVLPQTQTGYWIIPSGGVYRNIFTTNLNYPAAVQPLSWHAQFEGTFGEQNLTTNTMVQPSVWQIDETNNTIGAPGGTVTCRSGTSYVLTAAGTASAGVTVLTGTFADGGSNALAGIWFNVAGFDMSANNGLYYSTASSTTTLTILNQNGVSDTHAGTAQYGQFACTGTGGNFVGSVKFWPKPANTGKLSNDYFAYNLAGGINLAVGTSSSASSGTGGEGLRIGDRNSTIALPWAYSWQYPGSGDVFDGNFALNFTTNANATGALINSTYGAIGLCWKVPAASVDPVMGICHYAQGSVALTANYWPSLVTGGTFPYGAWNTVPAAGSASIGATTMATPTVDTNYRFDAYLSITAAGASCIASPTVAVNLISQDPAASGTTTQILLCQGPSTTGYATPLNLTAVANYNGAAGQIIGTCTATVRQKASVALQYSTTWANGTSCSPQPTYKIVPLATQY